MYRLTYRVGFWIGDKLARVWYQTVVAFRYGMRNGWDS